MNITFSNVVTYHTVPYEDRHNLLFADAIRGQIRINLLWIQLTKKVKKFLYRLSSPLDKRKKRTAALTY